MKVKSLILKEDEFEDVYGEMDQPFANTFEKIDVLDGAGSAIHSNSIGKVISSDYVEGTGIEIISKINYDLEYSLDKYNLCPTIKSTPDGTIVGAKNVFFTISSEDMVGETVKYTPSVLNNGLYE